jgi:hypothetical protein
MRSIQKAKEVKQKLIDYCNRDWPSLQAQVKIVMHKNDLAIELTFCRKPSTNWKTEHEGFPLLIKYPGV